MRNVSDEVVFIRYSVIVLLFKMKLKDYNNRINDVDLEVIEVVLRLKNN